MVLLLLLLLLLLRVYYSTSPGEKDINAADGGGIP